MWGQICTHFETINNTLLLSQLAGLLANEIPSITTFSVDNVLAICVI